LIYGNIIPYILLLLIY